MKFNLKNPYKKQSAEVYFKQLCDDKAIIEITELKPKRSLDQNALMWVWFNCISKETGIDKNHVYLLFRAMFLTKEDEYITKIIYSELWERIKIKINSFTYFKGLEDIIDIISYNTSGLEKDKFGAFLNKIQDYSLTELNIVLLVQEHENFNDFYNTYLE